MRKVIATLSIILILLSTLVPESRADIGKDMVEKWMSEGTGGLPTSSGNKDRKQLPLETGGNNQFSIVTAFLEIFIVPPKLLNWLMSMIVLNGQNNYEVNGNEYSLYTVQDMLLNQYYLFDIDFFNTTPPYKDDPNETLVNNIKENVAIWYSTLRNISLIGMAIIIVYVAIRIVLELTKSEGGPATLAKYKKMLMSWAIGFLILLVLPYFVKALFYISDLFTNIITGVIKSNTMEASIVADSELSFMGARGLEKIGFIVIYYVMVFYELKFFLMYLKRSLETFFLMIISPFVCMLYPIDKIGDGRSQSFSIWLDRLMSNIFLRPIQLLIYVIFIVTASELAVKQPIVAILFFMALSNGEKIIKLILGFGGPNLADQKLSKPQIPRHKHK